MISPMCLQLAQGEPSYVAQISARVVRMFQRYAWNIDPESEPFLTFINQYLAERNVNDPRAIPYTQLYMHIKDAIQAYLRESEPSHERRQSNNQSR